MRTRALLHTSLLGAGRPLSLKELSKVLQLSPDAVLDAIADLKKVLYEQDLGLFLEEIAGGYRLIVQPTLYADLAGIFSPPPLPKLSNAAIETLALIAYKQPVTRGELEAARGSSCASPLETLQERELIKIIGRKDVCRQTYAVWYNGEVFARVWSKITRRFTTFRGKTYRIPTQLI